jgi:hypothetical protein
VRDSPSLWGTRRETKEASDSTYSRQWVKLGCFFMIILGRGGRELLSIFDKLHEKDIFSSREIFKIADGDLNGR